MAQTSEQYRTQPEWLQGTKKEIRTRDKKESDFYQRITGLVVGTCPMTVGYIGKYTSEPGKPPRYYACRELLTIFQSWQWHCVYAPEINEGIKSRAKKFEAYKPEHKILITDSLSKAINFLKLEKHGI